jgi:hypothetical protein
VCERARVRPDRVKRILAAALAAGLAGGSCSDGGKAPTGPARLPDAAALIPAAPAPQPTPTPGAVPEDEIIVVTPGGGDTSVSGTCGEPFPPPVSRFNVKVHSRQADRVVLDATPLVGPDAEYCHRIGFTDGRTFCPVRAEGDPERQACEAAQVGRADDTGRYGPTWSANGGPCDGTDHGGASCANHSDNQYLANAYGAGVFRACASSGACGQIRLP